MARAAQLLADRYTLVITNVPYLARGKQGQALRVFCERNYPRSKNDLATAFLERCLHMCAEGGTASLVLPQNWLFLTSYRTLRQQLLVDGDVACACLVGCRGIRNCHWRSGQGRSAHAEPSTSSRPFRWNNSCHFRCLLQSVDWTSPISERLAKRPRGCGARRF